MNLSLPRHIEQLIDERVRCGKYKTAEDVIAAAVAQLDQQEQAGDFDPGELDRLLAEGEASGAALDGDAVLTELRSLRRRGQGKAG